MKAVIQRVLSASITVEGKAIAAIDRGLLVLVGIAQGDSDADADWLAGKVHRLRIFPDDRGRMSLAVSDIGGAVLVVSQFTLLADTTRGNRPDFLSAAPPAEAERLYLGLARRLEGLLARPVPTGVFAADMAVSLINDGPVTILLDSRQRADQRR